MPQGRKIVCGHSFSSLARRRKGQKQEKNTYYAKSSHKRWSCWQRSVTCKLDDEKGQQSSSEMKSKTDVRNEECLRVESEKPTPRYLRQSGCVHQRGMLSPDAESPFPKHQTSLQHAVSFRCVYDIGTKVETIVCDHSFSSLARKWKAEWESWNTHTLQRVIER